MLLHGPSNTGPETLTEKPLNWTEEIISHRETEFRNRVRDHQRDKEMKTGHRAAGKTHLVLGVRSGKNLRIKLQINSSPP